MSHVGCQNGLHWRCRSAGPDVPAARLGTDSVKHPNGNTDGYASPHSYGYASSHRDGHASSYSDGDAKSHSDGDGKSWCDGHADTDGHAKSHGHPKSHSQSDVHATYEPDTWIVYNV